MSSQPRYEEILEEARRMDSHDRLRLLEEIAASLLRDAEPKGGHSILELEGLGKEIWEGVDAQEYVNRERESWSG